MAGTREFDPQGKVDGKVVGVQSRCSVAIIFDYDVCPSLGYQQLIQLRKVGGIPVPLVFRELRHRRRP
eukprot:7206773-Alexandrium_andersonii.AAC.1